MDAYVLTDDILLALIYNAINSSMDHYRGKHDAYGGMAAGALTGALFKSTGKCISLPT